MSVCNNPKCSTSTGIHEGLTFGWGKLDEYGYWEFPCQVCADHWNNVRQKEVLEEILLERMQETGESREEAYKYLRERHEWLFIKA